MKIKLIGYDHIEHSLIVKFENGKIIKHESVSETEYENIKKFSSKEEAYENFINSKLPKNR
jgi:hypothetical protein